MIEGVQRMPNHSFRVQSGHSLSMLNLLAVLIFATIATPAAQGQSFKVLHAFAAGAADGYDPIYGSLILDASGNLYGVTSLGGDGTCDGGCGVVFKVDPTGGTTVLYSFSGTTADGKYPEGSLVMDAAGNLYGTTSGGGTSGAACNGYGCGTVYMLDPTGKETVLYNFSGGVDGATPNAGLVRDAAGNLYGTTYLGGAYDWGTAFMVDASGNETVLHSFNGATGDGGDVIGGLIRDTAGNLYGMTQGGGISGCTPDLNIGCGTIYQITPTGAETVLFSFPYPPTDGEWPGDERLLRDHAGNLYGTTQAGASDPSYGKIVKLDPAGGLTILHSFAGGAGGADPWAGLIRDPEGNLYGTTSSGGGGGGKCSGGCGTVFRLSTTGVFTVLHEFTGGPDGGIPFAGLVRDSAGNLYGMTLVGGIGDGVVFKITL
jgi:uncharacterized repeat protein (TIGR03803 family)